MVSRVSDGRIQRKFGGKWYTRIAGPGKKSAMEYTIREQRKLFKNNTWTRFFGRLVKEGGKYSAYGTWRKR